MQGGGEARVRADGVAAETCPSLSAFADVIAARGPDSQDDFEVRFFCLIWLTVAFAYGQIRVRRQMSLLQTIPQLLTRRRSK